MSKIKVGILGATGTVGQRAVMMLQDHPWFELTALAASDRSAGKAYGEACNWKVSSTIPETVRGMVINDCQPDLDCQVVFSSLPAEIAGEVEESFARAGYGVISNARNHRMAEDVPLLIPEVNPQHLDMISRQRERRGWKKGFIVTNPNCSTIHMVLALKPLQDAFGLRKVMVTTMQAASGAGYPGVPSLDLIDNVIPFIGGEEEKMESETLKLLGSLREGEFVPAPMKVSAQCNRVPVRESHLESVSVELETKASQAEVLAAFSEFKGDPQRLGLPSAPRRPIIVKYENDRPQPIMDRDLENGMASVVGRLRPCSIFDYKFSVLGHNTIRGAAGAVLLNAELLKSKGLI